MQDFRQESELSMMQMNFNKNDNYTNPIEFCVNLKQNMISLEEFVDQYSIVAILAKFLNLKDVQSLVKVNKQFYVIFQHFHQKFEVVLKNWKKSNDVIHNMSPRYPQFRSSWIIKDPTHSIVHFPLLGIITRLWVDPENNTSYVELSSNHIKSSVFILTPSNESFHLSIISTNMLLISASLVQDNRILNISDIIETQNIKWLLYDEISPTSIQPQFRNWSLCRNYYYYLCYSITRGNLIDFLNTDGKGQLSLPIDKILFDWREKQNYAIEKLYIQIFDGMNIISLGARISRWKDEKRLLCFLLRKNGNEYTWELFDNIFLLNDFEIFDTECIPVYCRTLNRFEILTTNENTFDFYQRSKNLN
jgi:hypothetical protein